MEILFEISDKNSLNLDSIQFATLLDELDNLSGFRKEFFIPKNEKNEEVIYLCGNSLGLQPKATRLYIENHLKKWENEGVEGHFSGFTSYYHHDNYFILLYIFMKKIKSYQSIKIKNPNLG